MACPLQTYPPITQFCPGKKNVKFIRKFNFQQIYHESHLVGRIFRDGWKNPTSVGRIFFADLRVFELEVWSGKLLLRAYSPFTLTWLIVNDFQVEFFSFNHRKQWKLSVCKKDITQVRVNALKLILGQETRHCLVCLFFKQIVKRQQNRDQNHLR